MTAENQRTDEQILMEEAVMVKFGGKKYPIKPLSIRKAREWRKGLSEDGAGIIDRLGKSGKAMDEAKLLLIEIPDKVSDLIFSYAPELPKEIIMEEATDKELVAAFREVMKLAYPFGEELLTLRALIPANR